MCTLSERITKESAKKRLTKKQDFIKYKHLTEHLSNPQIYRQNDYKINQRISLCLGDFKDCDLYGEAMEYYN